MGLKRGESRWRKRDVMCDVCWEENGVWVLKEESADGEREKEEREDN